MGSIARHMVCGMLALLFLCPPALALSSSPTLSRITLANTNADLLLHLTLEGSFSEKLKRSVLDGAPASFVFIIRLHEVRDLWFDRQIADLTAVHTIKYDRPEARVRGPALLEEQRGGDHALLRGGAAVDEPDR